MGWFETIVLAVIQGLTEFLPVSSSGHLVLAKAILGVDEPGVVTEVVLHLGTLGAVLIYFRAELFTLLQGILGRPQSEPSERKSARFYALALIVGTIPIGLVGFFMEARIDSLFHDPRTTCFSLLATGMLLLSTRLVRRGEGKVSVASGGVIGLFQAAALVPGLSRSGLTITGALYLGVDRVEAARFSFLLSIPAILGAAVLNLSVLFSEGSGIDLGSEALGFVISFAVGYGAISLLMQWVRRGRFAWFGIYCLLIGLAGLLWIG